MKKNETIHLMFSLWMLCDCSLYLKNRQRKFETVTVKFFRYIIFFKLQLSQILSNVQIRMCKFNLFQVLSFQHEHIMLLHVSCFFMFHVFSCYCITRYLYHSVIYLFGYSKLFARLLTKQSSHFLQRFLVGKQISIV